MANTILNKALQDTTAVVKQQNLHKLNV